MLSSVTRLRNLQTSFAFYTVSCSNIPLRAEDVVVAGSRSAIPPSLELTEDGIGPTTTYRNGRPHPFQFIILLTLTSSALFSISSSKAISWPIVVSWGYEVPFTGADGCRAAHRTSPRSTPKVVIVPPAQILGSHPTHTTGQVTVRRCYPGNIVSPRRICQCCRTRQYTTTEAAERLEASGCLRDARQMSRDSSLRMGLQPSVSHCQQIRSLQQMTVSLSRATMTLNCSCCRAYTAA